MMPVVIRWLNISAIIVFGYGLWFASGLPCSVSRVSGDDDSRDSVVVDCKSLGLLEVQWALIFSHEIMLVNPIMP